MDEIEKKLWKKTRRYIRILQIVPFLRMVSVCNNLAFGKINKKSDIDLFIIAKSGRLFIVRSLVTFLLHIFGVRRHGKKIAGRFCLSFFVDDRALNLSPIAISNDIYLAYWIKTMIPLIDDGVMNDFLNNNRWARKYFENKKDFFINKDNVIPYSSFKKAVKYILKWFLDGGIGDFIEKKVKNWQINRANEKAKKIDKYSDLIISDHILKFHNIDRRRQYRTLWERKYGREKITSERFSQLSL